MNYQTVKIASVTVAAAVASSKELIYADKIGGRFHVPVGSTTTEITWYDTTAEGGTYLVSRDENGTILAQTVTAEGSYEIPPALAGAFAIKAVASGGDAGTIDVVLKG